MANNYCTFIPSKGQQLFKQLHKQFGYKTARKIFLKAINPNFILDYKKSIELDNENVPTYESLMHNSFIRNFIGTNKIIESLSKFYKPLEDTIENYNKLLLEAYSFNTTNAEKDNITATVEYTDDNKITIKLQPKDKIATDRFNNQYSTQQLNQRLVDIFKPIGLTIGHLNKFETESGRIGITDFSKAKSIANNFDSLIRVANNMEGAQAISEEFAHLIVGIFREEPLVSRAINVLANNKEALLEVLGDNFNDVLDFYDGDMYLIAEEAVGHLLQKNLISTTSIEQTPAPSLFKRLINYIISKFKIFKVSDVLNAISEADSSMNRLAKNILNGSTQITQEDIQRSNREAQFNALSDRIERNISILKEAAKTELKRYKISNLKDAKDAISQNVQDILSFTQEDADTVEGILNYAKQALSSLRNLDLEFSTIDRMDSDYKFTFLRLVRTYIQSYDKFIKALNDASLDEENEEDNMFLKNFEINDKTINIQDILKDLNNLSGQLNRKYTKYAIPAFTEFLKPFLGEDIVIPFGKKAGQTISIEDLITESNQDITFMDRWLDSMADSADTLLQLFDAAVKSAKDKARLETIDNIKAIQRVMAKAESYGITDFEWMFEKDNEGHKSGNYISGINLAQFLKDINDLELQLNEKYGINPTGLAAKDKMEERKKWYDVHAIGFIGSAMADPVIYRNTDFDNLTENQKEILFEFLHIKNYLDKKLPKNRVSDIKAIQIRKQSGQRFIDMLSNPSLIFDNVKESIKTTFVERVDDDLMFGDSQAKKGLTDFAGNEFMTLPILFTNRLENADEISTDVFGSLIQYAYMANNYQQMDKIIDPLEIGRTIVLEERKIKETRGNNPVIEKFDALGTTVINKTFKTQGAYIEQKLNDFFESQVYGKYLKDEGTFDMFGNKVNVNKLTSFILKGSSLAQLGFNWLANIANLTTGVSMQNIEAAAGEYFNAKELFKADKEYITAMKDFSIEIGSRIKTSKLALFNQLFNIKLDFDNRVKTTKTKNLLKRLFGSHIAFLGQDAGDHWLYNRTAIAMALRKQVLYDGKQMSLWEALKVKDVYEDNKSVKELNITDIKELDGSNLNIAEFSRQVANVNQHLFGIYNTEDSNAANRLALGRLLMQYRKWIKPQMNKRFQKGQYSVADNQYVEGYYRTFVRMLNELIRGKVQLSEQWDNMTDHEKANIKRSITELIQFTLVWALANWIEWPDDKNRPWGIKLAEYTSKRLSHELGGLTPSTVMVLEQLKNFKNPLPILSLVDNTFNLINSVFDPSDYVDEIQSGPYKGMSTLEKNFIKAPIPGVAQYRLIEKFIGNIDTSIQYYMRPY